VVELELSGFDALRHPPRIQTLWKPWHQRCWDTPVRAQPGDRCVRGKSRRIPKLCRRHWV